MKVGIAKETLPGETRVAVIPETVKRLVEKGMEVGVEAGAGAAASFFDEDFTAAGATIEKSRKELLEKSDLVLKICPPLV